MSIRERIWLRRALGPMLKLSMKHLWSIGGKCGNHIVPARGYTRSRNKYAKGRGRPRVPLFAYQIRRK